MLTANMTCLDGLRIAYDVASQSTDESTHTGAILVDRGRGILARAFNRLAGGDTIESHGSEKTWKYRNTIHAEAGAILSAAKQSIRTSGLILVSPWAPCCECAKCIVGAGIVEVIVHKELMAMTPERWKEDIAEAIKILQRCGVRYEAVTGKLGVGIRFDGKDVEL